MTARVSYTRELLIALLVAVWVHVAIFMIFVVLLVFELIAGKILDSVERENSETDQSEITELTVFFEEEVHSEPLEHQTMKVRAHEESKFAVTDPNEEAEKPDEAEFIGENDSVATSDSKAKEGWKKEVALSGEDEVKDDIKARSTDFSEGEEPGTKMDLEGEGAVGSGLDAVTQKEIKPAPAEPKMTNDDASDEFEKTEGEEREIEDAMEKKVVKKEAPQPVVDPTLSSEKNEANEKSQVAKRRGGGSQGGFQTKQTKTRIRGSLNASGKGSLNVANTALGRYEAKIFKEIERQWQARNFQFRSHLAPGFITLSFHLDEKGNVSGQRRTDMRGTSGIQWGLVLQSVSEAKIPAMPKEVIKELNGEALELTVTFNY